MDIKTINSGLYKIKKTAAYLKHYGPVKLARKAWGKVLERDSYPADWKSLAPSEEELFAQRSRSFPYMPLISILVPVFDPPKQYFEEMLLSVLDQTYFNWQLCIVDAGVRKCKDDMDAIVKGDSRVCYRAVKNGGIAANTNMALEMAEGEYIALLDNDDVLSLEALYRMVEKLNEEGGDGERADCRTIRYADCLYSDEDKIDGAGKAHFCPHIKPDYNPTLLRSNNYICHLFMVRRRLAREVGGFSTEYDGAQDYDFILKCTENSKKVAHVARILYHWRTHEGSTAGNPLSKKYAYVSGKKAIEAHLARTGRTGNVKMLDDMGFYRVDYDIESVKKIRGGELPHVKAVVVGAKDKETAQDYFKYVRESSDYKNLSLCAMREPDICRLSGQETDYFMVLAIGTRLPDRGWLKRLLAFAEAEGADAAAARLVSGRFLEYGGPEYVDAFGRRCTDIGKPAWYRGRFNRGILQSRADRLPKTGIFIKKQAYIDMLAKKPYRCEAGGLFVYEPGVTLSLKDRKGLRI